MKGFFSVPQAEEWIIERWGKYLFTAKPGLNVIIPIGARIREKHLIAEQSLQMFVDPVDFDFIDGASGIPIGMLAFVIVKDSRKATYKVNNWKESVVNLLESKIRAAVTKLTEQEARQLQKNILKALKPSAQNELHAAMDEWGVEVRRVVFKDIKLSQKTLEARSALFEQKRKKDVAAIERKIRAEKGMGTYIESQALSQNLSFEEVQAAIAKSPKLKKESREFARILTQDAMKLEAGALKEWNINVPQGTTLEGLIGLLGEALSGRGGPGGGSGGSANDSSSKEGGQKKKYRRFSSFNEEAKKWLDDFAEGKE